MSEITLRLTKVCYKVSLCENCQLTAHLHISRKNKLCPPPPQIPPSGTGNCDSGINTHLPLSHRLWRSEGSAEWLLRSTSVCKHVHIVLCYFCRLFGWNSTSFEEIWSFLHDRHFWAAVNCSDLVKCGDDIVVQVVDIAKMKVCTFFFRG